jgi:uncharacterized membrane protein
MAVEKRGMKRILMAGCLGFGLGFAAVPAKADLQLCNHTGSKVQAAVGYKDKDGWVSEGWWTAGPQGCMKLVPKPLQARYYYIYATDPVKGGNWGGKALFCVKRSIFTLRGINDCAGRGLQQQGFFEVDTGEKTDWTVNLSDDKAPATPPAAPDPAAATPADPKTNTEAQPLPLPTPDAGGAATPTNNTQQGQ